jgi:tetratricopeptide (TPR) repeat protein
VVAAALAPAVLAVAPWGLGKASSSVRAQTVDAREEGRRLREASSLESRGELGGAEEVLRALLEGKPTSSGGIFALERVLRARGRPAEILPLADRYLALDEAASGIRYLKLRVMVEVDSLATLDDEAERWIGAEPGSPDPYREVARIYERAFGPERAVAVLRRARTDLRSPALLAVELGDLLARVGDVSGAVTEWSHAIGPEGAEVGTIVRRLEGVAGDREVVVRPLLEALDREPTTGARRRAGARIALEAGLGADALRLAERALPGLGETERRGFVSEFARRAEEARAWDVALWAYGELRTASDGDREARALDVRIAAAALAAGDTARAVEAQRRVARTLPPGSVDRRRVVADLIRVEAHHADGETLAERLEGFRREFPDAPELDELAAVVAAGLRARGLDHEAVDIVRGVQGPLTSLERGFLHLEGSRVDEGVEALSEALSGLPPTRATEILQLVSLLGRLERGGQEVLARSAALHHRGRTAEAVEAVREGLPALPAPEQAALLAHAARMADEGSLTREGAGLREELLSRHAGAPERGEATLALARYRARDAGGVAEAVRLLEALILERPDSPVAPDARRELQRLQRGVERRPGPGVAEG